MRGTLTKYQSISKGFKISEKRYKLATQPYTVDELETEWKFRLKFPKKSKS